MAIIICGREGIRVRAAHANSNKINFGLGLEILASAGQAFETRLICFFLTRLLFLGPLLVGCRWACNAFCVYWVSWKILVRLLLPLRPRFFYGSTFPAAFKPRPANRKMYRRPLSKRKCKSHFLCIYKALTTRFPKNVKSSLI